MTASRNLIRKRRPYGLSRAEVAAYEVEQATPDEEGCLISDRAPGKNGYFPVKMEGEWTTLHHLVAEASYGPRPEGEEVRHLCGNRSCINPDHLAYGPPWRNQEDAWRHGTHATRKLTDDNVRLIRRWYSPGKRGNAHSLARAFGVGPRQINKIAKRQSLKHVAEES